MRSAPPGSLKGVLSNRTDGLGQDEKFNGAWGRLKSHNGHRGGRFRIFQ